MLKRHCHRQYIRDLHFIAPATGKALLPIMVNSLNVGKTRLLVTRNKGLSLIPLSHLCGSSGGSLPQQNRREPHTGELGISGQSKSRNKPKFHSACHVTTRYLSHAFLDYGKVVR